MKNLETLIQELCPDGVEFVKLGECCNFVNGFAFKSTKFKEKGDTIIRITNINGTGVDVNDVKYFDKSDYKANWQTFEIHKGDILIAMSGATTGKVGIYNNKTVAYLNQRVGKIVPDKSKLVNRFLYHILLSKNQFLYMLAGGGAQPNLSSTKLMNVFEIPLPPIEVQTEIVRILDKFTSLEAQLEAELEAELDCRKRQYEYYRDKLLSFDNVGGQEVEWKKMGEVCKNICSGGTPLTSKPEYYDGNIPWLRTQEVDYCEIHSTLRNITQLGLKNSSAKMIPANCVIVAMYGATAAKVAINKIPLCTNQACCNLEIDEKQALVRYVYQWICKQYEVLKAMGEGSQHNINAKKVKDFKIPIPSLEEQRRIVSILDRFESLTTSLQSGLPAEIAARRQQYEHYRDKLLTFKRKRVA